MLDACTTSFLAWNSRFTPCSAGSFSPGAMLPASVIARSTSGVDYTTSINALRDSSGVANLLPKDEQVLSYTSFGRCP